MTKYGMYDVCRRVGGHSAEGIEFVKEIIDILENITDGCAERFPFETIDELKKEYLA